MVATPGSDSITRNGSPSVPGVCVSSSAASLTSGCVGFARTTVSKDCSVPAGASRSASGSVVVQGSTVLASGSKPGAWIHSRRSPQGASTAKPPCASVAPTSATSTVIAAPAIGFRVPFARTRPESRPTGGAGGPGTGMASGAPPSAAPAVRAVARVATVAPVAAVAPHARVRGPRVHRERHRQQGDGDDHGTVATQMPS